MYIDGHAAVFVFSPNLFIHRSECFRLIRECSFFKSAFFLRFIRRFKAYTHELTVIDFIVVVCCFFRLAFVSSSVRCIRFSVIYFNLFVLEENNILSLHFLCIRDSIETSKR